MTGSPSASTGRASPRRCSRHSGSPILGRAFDTNDDRPEQPADVLVLILERLWRERFESDAEVLGRSFRLDGRSHTVVGVTEAGFRFPEWAEGWTPLGLDAEATDGPTVG